MAAKKKKKKSASKKKSAPKKKTKAASKQQPATTTTSSVLKLKTFPQGEEGIDLVCETKMPNKDIPRGLEVSPTGRFVVAGHNDGGCTVIDVELGEARDLVPSNANIRFVGFLDRERALIADDKGFMRVVELKSGAERVVVPARKGKNALLFCFVLGEGLAAYCFTGSGVFTWREGAGEKKLDTKESVNNIAVDGSTVYAALVGKKGRPAIVKAWDATSGKETRTLTAAGDTFVDRLLVAGRRIVAVTGDTPTVFVWDESGTNTVNVALPEKCRVDFVTVLDDDKRIAVAQEGTLAHVNLDDGTMNVGSMARWRLVDARGNTGVVVDSKKRIGIYDLASRELVLERASKQVISGGLATDRVTMLSCGFWGDISVYRAHPPS